MCNVLYKIVAKVLTNKLKSIMPYIISPNQFVFVPRHLITNNLVISYETLHYMKLGVRVIIDTWHLS